MLSVKYTKQLADQTITSKTVQSILFVPMTKRGVWSIFNKILSTYERPRCVNSEVWKWDRHLLF